MIWSRTEVSILRHNYYFATRAQLLELLPHRTETSIVQKAHVLQAAGVRFAKPAKGET